MNDYHKHFKNLTELKLLNIIENSADYDVKAVEAAKSELANRPIGEEEILEIQNEIRGKKERKVKQSEQIESIKNTVKKNINKVENYLDPQVPKSTETILKTIAGLLVINGLVAFFGQLKYLSLIFYDPEILAFLILDPSWIILTVLCVYGGVKLWKMKRLGWIISNGLFAFLIVWNMFMAYDDWQISQMDFDSPLMNVLAVETKGIVYFLTMLILLAAMIWYLNKKEILHLYKITVQTQWMTIGIGAVIGITLGVILSLL